MIFGACMQISIRSSRLILAAALIFQTLAHLFWLSIPTTGGQIAVPWLMSQGMTLFDTVIENRAPASVALMAVVHRVSPFAPIDNVRLVNTILVLLITLLVYFVALRLSRGNGLAASTAVIFWLLWEPVYANLTFYFDTVLGALILLALMVWLWLDGRRPSWLGGFLVGLILGVGVLTKQHGWGAVGLFGLWLLVYRRSWRDLVMYALGAALLPLLSLLIFAAQGSLDAYLYFTYTYNLSGYITPSPVEGNFIRKLLLTNLLAPAFLLLIWQRRRDAAAGERWILLGTLYIASLLPLIPHLGEIHAATHLPFLAVMVGLLISEIARSLQGRAGNPFSVSELALGGIALATLLAWGLTVIAPYFHAPLGRAKTPGYDEFWPLVEQVNTMKQEGDTLEVLPKLAGSSNLFEMTQMRSPGLWAYSDASFYFVPGLSDRILEDWAQKPPDWVIYFPELRDLYVGQAIDPLIEFVLESDRYTLAATVEAIMFNGDAQIFRLKETPNGG